jgi:hypothetical protein
MSSTERRAFQRVSHEATLAVTPAAARTTAARCGYGSRFSVFWIVGWGAPMGTRTHACAREHKNLKVYADRMGGKRGWREAR